ncbi:MAG: GNAT family N-acetyltransferase [Comamonas sp.]
MSPEFSRIDISSRFEICVGFRRLSFLSSFGSLDGFSQEMGQDSDLYRKRLTHHIAQVPDGNLHLWVGGAIVGQCEAKTVADEAVGYISLLCLTPEARGQGYGRLMHERLVQVFGERGKRRLNLSVSWSNQLALGFYRRLGWRDLGPRPDKPSVALMEFLL